MSGNEISELMAEIKRTAPVKKHSLAADMVNGRRELSVPAARQVLSHLAKCRDIAPAREEDQEAEDHRVSQAHRTLPVLGDFKGIPAGFYATKSRTGNNDLDFWKVRCPKKGKWAGWSFADRVLGGAGAEGVRTEKLNNIQQRQALQAIREAGFEPAKKAFADALGFCSECGSPLTNETSRAYGKGPVCRTK